MNLRIFHFTIPKCGSQWVRDVLSTRDIWPDFKLRPAKEGLNLSSTREQILGLDGNFFSPVYNFTRYHWDAFRREGDRAVVIIRDPRDRLVSLLFGTLYSHMGGAYTETWRQILFSQKSISENLKLLMLAEGPVLPIYFSWCGDIPADCMVVRYEDLVHDQQAGFRNIANWFGLRVAENALGAAVDRHSFETRSGRSRGKEDKFSHYRRGSPGDWRNYFDRSLGQLWEELYPEALRQIGYENSSVWWQSLPDSHEYTESKDRADTDRHLVHADRIEALVARVKTLEKENQEKQKVIQDLSDACDARQEVVVGLDQAARERLDLIHRLDAEIRRLQAIQAG